MTRFSICALFSMIALGCATAGIASAAQPTVITPPDYKGSCPATVHFGGTLFPPAGSVSYHFGYHDPGQTQNSVTPKRTVAAVGPFSATDTGTVTASGAAWVELTEDAPQLPKPTPSTSTRAGFQVHCTFGALPPGIRFSVWASPPLMAWDWRNNHYQSGIGMPPESGQNPACETICAGFIHQTTGGGAPFGYHSIDDWRSYMQFGKIPNPPKPPTQAVLILTFSQPTANLRCIEGVAPALDTWQGNKNWINGGTFVQPTIPSTNLSGPLLQSYESNQRNVVFDVTSIVRAWSAGTPNHGFVIAGSNESGSEDPPWNGNTICLVNFVVPPVLLIR
ncbi:MAG: hypothetical protein JO193_03540 [Candidatus Eremiobacteraeota bacterium]|nr:hypothetical protein [Candidatus Eremiobacteraeota bacterium]MBV9972947.1 hypothetical protein [Candidatus Eremiobacteraeota bacterium]